MGPSGFSQRLTMHLNGGSDYSWLHYRITAAGQDTAITRVRATDGAPRYRITGDVFLCAGCGGELDILEGRSVGLLDWLREHAAHRAAGE